MSHFPARKMIVVAGDAACFYAALYTALAFRYLEVPDADAVYAHTIPFTALLAAWIIVFYIADLYNFSLIKKRGMFYPRAFLSIVGAFVLSVLMFYFIPLFNITPKTTLLLHALVFSAFFFIWRSVCIRFGIRIAKKKTAFWGDEKHYHELADKLNANPLVEHELVFRVQEDISPDALLGAFRERKIDALIVQDALLSSLPFSLSSYLTINRNIHTLGTFYEDQFQEIPQDVINEQRVLQHVTVDERTMYQIAKRIMDIVASLLFLVVLGGIFIPLYIVLKTCVRRPIFYVQQRCAQGGRVFTLIKFRTMRCDAEQDGPQWALKGDARVTRVGRFLRHTHIDELPQLFNILRGDLSFIGPRPERPEFVRELEQAIPYYSLRHLIKPGVTGWAQINYPYGASIDDARRKLSFDLYYIKHRCLTFDIKILLKTIAYFFKGEGR